MKKELRRLLCAMLCVGIMIVSLVGCNQTTKTESKTDETQQAETEEQVKIVDNMILTCDNEQLVYGLDNGISRNYKDLIVYTNYPIVVYQLVGRTGIIKNDYFEGNHEVNTFCFEKTEETFYEIRLAAFDNSGNQVESQTYYIQYLD